MFDWEHGIALHPGQRIRALTPAECDDTGISRVAAGTWGTFSSYSVDGRSKLHLVQRSQHSYLVSTDNSGS